MSKYDELNLEFGKTERLRQERNTASGFNSEVLDRLRHHIGDEVFTENEIAEKNIESSEILIGEVVDKEVLENRIQAKQNAVLTCMPYVRTNAERETTKYKLNFSNIIILAFFAGLLAVTYFFMPSEFMFLKDNIQNKSNINFLAVTSPIIKEEPAVNNPINYTPKVFAKTCKVENGKILYQGIYNSLVYANCSGVVADTVFDVTTNVKTIIIETNGTVACLSGFLNLAVKKGDILKTTTILGDAFLGGEIMLTNGE